MDSLHKYSIQNVSTNPQQFLLSNLIKIKILQVTLNKPGNYKNDDKAFLFSFTNNEKYPIKTPEKAIYASNSHLVIYGHGYDICIFDNCNTNNMSSSDFPHSYSCSKYPSKSEESKAYLAGTNKFKVVDIEIFAIIWI